MRAVYNDNINRDPRFGSRSRSVVSLDYNTVTIDFDHGAALATSCDQSTLQLESRQLQFIAVRQQRCRINAEHDVSGDRLCRIEGLHGIV